jgi:hypothetical protein
MNKSKSEKAGPWRLGVICQENRQPKKDSCIPSTAFAADGGAAFGGKYCFYLRKQARSIDTGLSANGD